MSIASRLTVLAFVSATTAAGAQSTPTNTNSASTAVTGGNSNNAISAGTGDTSTSVNVINYPTQPQTVTQDLGSCDGPVFQAIFYKAAYGQTEVKRLELGPRHTGYESRQIPDQSLIEITPTSVTFEIKSGRNYGAHDRTYIANEIKGTPAEISTVSAKAETTPVDVNSTATGGSNNQSSQVTYTSSNVSAAFSYRPPTYLTFTCTN